MKRPIVTAIVLTAIAVALGIASLAWPTSTLSQDNDEMVNCPQAGKWSIAVWGGPSDTDAQTALDTCADTSVVAAYHLDPDTQGWLRWFAGRPEISNLSTLDELQGVLALGSGASATAATGVESVTAAQADEMVNCPQSGKWSIAVWSGDDSTDAGQALATCGTGAIAAAYYIDPETQGWLRWFADRPEISNLQSLDDLQGVLALGSVTGPTPTPGEITFSVDESVTPAVSELPGFEDGVPRPLASMTDELGNQADFVADELLLVTNDPAALDDFLARWEGEVLLTFDPTEYGLTGMSPMYLVRINTALADASALEADLRALTQDGQGDHRVSSQEALDLLAAASSEAADGLDIGVNWVGTGTDFRSRTTTEAPTGPGGYSSNTFNWSHLNAGSTQDIGVTEAWRALDIMERLDNTVQFAVLDMGFEPDDDFPLPWTAISNVPFADPIGTENFADCGGSPCPYHGTNVVGAGMGVPDNDWGGAGVAGPVAEPILVFTLYDFATGVVAVARAASEGADIINMSYGARVPFIVSWTVFPFEWTTEAVRDSGVLLFAASGNDNANVDAEDCLWPFDWPCWEEAWHTPCENDGVICVGALAHDSQDRAGYSNFGPEHVDIFAPGTNWVGPDPDNPGNIAQSVSGTSAASPYAAGVAALIWAADPSLNADEVEDILYATAHTSPDANVDRYVNAYDGVMMAMGPAPPQISITSPSDGSSHSRGADSIAFIADAFDVEDDTLTITWTSSLDGEIGTGTHVYLNDLSTGTHTITVTATDSDGLTDSDTITITIVNDPPTVEITSPGDGAELFQGQTIHLRGTSQDPNTVPVPYAPLPDAQVQWLIDGTPHATGHEASIPGGTLSLGSHTISFTGSDGELEHTDTHTITVVAGTGIDVQITSPANDDQWAADAFDSGEELWYKEVTLVGEATDPEDGPLSGGSLVWTTSINGGPEEELGTGESVIVRLYAPVATSTHVITLTATDSDDNSVTDTITVTVILLI
jgi:serine protease